MSDLMKLDLYLLLGVSDDSTQQEIKKSYRRRALDCHPDKNPDNPKAAELFRQLSKALEILTDSTAKSAYDKLVSARKASSLRNRRLDSKRRKLKDELEAREKAAKDEVISEAEAAAKLSAEIERLRKEGSKQLETENELLKKEIEQEFRLKVEMKLKNTEKLPRIKIRRKTKNIEFSDQSLRQYFSRFGDISCLVIAKNKKTALIEFTRYESVVNVYESEHQLFTIEWIDSEPQLSSNQSEKDSTKARNESQFNEFVVTSDQTFSNDYESVVLRNLRLAEERKQLIKQLEEENNCL